MFQPLQVASPAPSARSYSRTTTVVVPRSTAAAQPVRPDWQAGSGTVPVRIVPPALSGSVTVSPSAGWTRQASRGTPLTGTRHLPQRPFPPQAAGME